MSEAEKLAKTKRQLLIIGVSCVTVVVVLLWLLSLRQTFADNRARYQNPASAYQSMKAKLGELRKQFKNIKTHN